MEEFERYDTNIAVDDSSMHELGCGMLQNYSDWNPPFEVHDREVSVITELVYPQGMVVYKGTIDALVRYQGKEWLLDYKTCSRFPPESALSLDEQVGAYLHLARTTEFAHPVGFLWLFCRKKLPAVPQVLKGGGLSKRADMDTTAAVYARTAKEAGISLAGDEFYAKLLSGEAGREFFKLVPIRKSPVALDWFGKRLYETIGEMIDPNVVIYANPSWYNCPSCAFEEPCKLLHDGIDPRPTLEANYVKRMDLEDAEEDME
jgi:hypothetical protein